MEDEPRVVPLAVEAAVDVVVGAGLYETRPPDERFTEGLLQVPLDQPVRSSTPPSLTSMKEPTLREWSPMHATMYQRPLK